MTIPPPGQLRQVQQMTLRARVAWAITAAALVAFLTSLLLLLSFGFFIGVGAIPLFLLGAWLSPSPKRKALAVGGICWGTFCLIVLVVAMLS